MSQFLGIQTFCEMHANLLRPQATLALQRTANQSHLLLHLWYFCISAQGRNTIQPISVVWRHSTPSRHSSVSAARECILDLLCSNSARHYKRVAECISAAENSVTARYSICESELLLPFTRVHMCNGLKVGWLSRVGRWSSIHC